VLLRLDAVVWFVLSNAKTIWNRTAFYNEVPQIKGDGTEYHFGQAYKTGSSGQQRFVLISKRVLFELLLEKKNKYNQEKQLMKLDDLTLVLWPVQGLKGWQAYQKIAEAHSKVPSKKVSRRSSLGLTWIDDLLN
jgi:hypothetical protein